MKKVKKNLSILFFVILLGFSSFGQTRRLYKEQGVTLEYEVEKGDFCKTNEENCATIWTYRFYLSNDNDKQVIFNGFPTCNLIMTSLSHCGCSWGISAVFEGVLSPNSSRTLTHEIVMPINMSTPPVPEWSVPSFKIELKRD